MDVDVLGEYYVGGGDCSIHEEDRGHVLRGHVLRGLFLLGTGHVLRGLFLLSAHDPSSKGTTCRTRRCC